MQAEGEIANEFVWNLEEVPPGVYHCRLEINGSAGNAVELWNIAVVK